MSNILTFCWPSLDEKQEFAILQPFHNAYYLIILDHKWKNVEASKTQKKDDTTSCVMGLIKFEKYDTKIVISVVWISLMIMNVAVGIIDSIQNIEIWKPKYKCKTGKL